MKTKSGAYFTTYLQQNGQYILLEEDTRKFCEKWIKPVHPKNWDWTTRDFNNPENKPTIEEARVIRDLLMQDMDSKTDTVVDLSNLENVEQIRFFMDPNSKDEAFNMESLLLL